MTCEAIHEKERRYQDIRGVTRKCNQNKPKEFIIVNLNQRFNAMNLRPKPAPAGGSQLVKLIRAQGGCLGTKSR